MEHLKCTCMIVVALAVTALVDPAAHAVEPVYSELFGRSGERWEPGGRLPDFSYAGYHRGEKPLPVLEGSVSVKDFGAIGDGVADDTEAFRHAIEQAHGKTILIPAGRYKITNVLAIKSTGTCLKGAGPLKTTLVCPVPLNDIRKNWGATTGGRRTSNYSWSGGILRVSGTFQKDALATVTTPCSRGDRALKVSNVDAFKPGDTIRLTLTDTPDNSLATHLYADDPGPISEFKGRCRQAFVCRAERVHTEASIVFLDRALRSDIRLEWNPQLYTATSTVEEVGIEDIGFEFPVTPYRGHFTEVGYNALAMTRVRNCWVRNIHIQNADSGMFVNAENVTLHGITIESERAADAQLASTGHHGITLSGQDCLLTEFRCKTRFIHDITMTAGSAGNVVSESKGIDLALDHHRRAPHSNLFTAIDLGAGTRMFRSGGGADLGRHCGAYETFWCVRAEQPQTCPDDWSPPLINLVGVVTDAPRRTNQTARWLEPIPPERLQPCNLHEAQLRHRLSRQ